MWRNRPRRYMDDISIAHAPKTPPGRPGLSYLATLQAGEGWQGEVKGRGEWCII